MARKPNKHVIAPSLAIAGTDGNDTIIGSNRDDQPGDVLDGGAGNDYLDGLQGADTLIGGSGADTFKVHSWASSNVSTGVDTITDFESADVIDLTNLQHYSQADMAGAVSRAVNFGDVSLEPIAGGNILRVEVVAGDDRWNVTMNILGETPTEENFLFAA
jgi:hypothetical protein